MTDVEGVKELYVTLGVGGVSFIILVCILGYLLKQVYPILNSILQMMEVLKEVFNNNTKAIAEMSKSNQNVATALSLLNRSMTNVETKIDEVKETNESIEKTMIKLEERTKRGD